MVISTSVARRFGPIGKIEVTVKTATRSLAKTLIKTVDYKYVDLIVTGSEVVEDIFSLREETAHQMLFFENLDKLNKTSESPF